MSDDDICPYCHKTFVPGCEKKFGGSAHILTVVNGRLRGKACKNMTQKQMNDFLVSIHPQLGDIPTPEGYKTPLRGRIKDDLFFPACDWGTFLSHLKVVVGIEFVRNREVGEIPPNVKVVTDQDLINIYVGADREWRSVESRVAPPALVIVRLGHLVHYNSAAAEVLRMALRTRRGLGKPTWIVEPPDQSFKPFVKGDFGTSSGMVSCDDGTANYVKTHYEEMELDPVRGAQIEAPQLDVYFDEDTDTVSVGPIKSPSELLEVARDDEEEEPVVEDDDDWEGQFGSSTKKKKFGRRGGRR